MMGWFAYDSSPQDNGTAPARTAQTLAEAAVQADMVAAARELVEFIAVLDPPGTTPELDYSPASLAAVDRTLDVYHDRGDELPGPLHRSSAAYIFEVARRAFGGRYLAVDDAGDPHVLVIGRPDFAVVLYALSKVSKRVRPGGGDTIATFYDNIASAVAQKTDAAIR